MYELGIVTYLGISFPIEDFIFFKQNSIKLLENERNQNAIAEIKNVQMTSNFVYEIQLNGQLDNLNPQSKIETPVEYEDARNALNDLFITLQENIEREDYAEVYICWSGDESEEALGSSVISLKLQALPEVLSEERFLITFKN